MEPRRSGCERSCLADRKRILRQYLRGIAIALTKLQLMKIKRLRP
jgi:hypothetical protein